MELSGMIFVRTSLKILECCGDELLAVTMAGLIEIMNIGPGKRASGKYHIPDQLDVRLFLIEFLGVEYEMRCGEYQHACLEFGASKHQRVGYIRALFQFSLC